MQGCYLSRKAVRIRIVSGYGHPLSGYLVCTAVHIYPAAVAHLLATLSTAATKEVQGAPVAAAVHGTFLVLTQMCLHALNWASIWWGRVTNDSDKLC